MSVVEFRRILAKAGLRWCGWEDILVIIATGLYAMSDTCKSLDDKRGRDRYRDHARKIVDELEKNDLF